MDKLEDIKDVIDTEIKTIYEVKYNIEFTWEFEGEDRIVFYFQSLPKPKVKIAISFKLTAFEDDNWIDFVERMFIQSYIRALEEA